MVTSVASFSWQRAAVRRACSSGVRSVSLASSSGSPQSTQAPRTGRAERLRPRPSREPNRRSTRRVRHEHGSPTTRPGRDPCRTRRFGPVRASRRRTDSTSARSTPGLMATASRTSSSTRSGDFQRLERCELVRAQHEVGIGRATRFERVDRASVLVELDDSFGKILERQTCRARASSRPGSSRRLWPGSATTRTRSSLSRSSRTAVRPSATWPSCGGSKTPPRIPVTATRAPPRRPPRARHA